MKQLITSLNFYTQVYIINFSHEKTDQEDLNLQIKEEQIRNLKTKKPR